MRSLGIALGSFVLLSAATAFAQRDAASKAMGEYNFYGGGASSAMRSAMDYSANYRQYAQRGQPVSPEVAREAADSIGTYITKAQKHFASMRKSAQGINDKETLTALDSIDNHLANAAKSHAEMKDHCLKDNPDAVKTMECCKTIDADLAKAIAEHDKLMKKLGSKK